jgi:hypothetical protein
MYLFPFIHQLSPDPLSPSNPQGCPKGIIAPYNMVQIKPVINISEHASLLGL